MIAYRFAHVFFSFWFRCMNRLIIRGRENIPAEGAVIFYGNHSSNWDPLLLNAVFPRHIRFMAKHTLFHTPVVGACCRSYGAFPVDRTKVDLTATKTALRILKDGGVLGIFPEGTRVLEEEDSAAKGGIALFAWRSGAILQPVHVVYRRRVQIFNHIEVTFGRPIPASALPLSEKPSSEDYQRVGAELMEAVYRL